MKRQKILLGAWILWMVLIFWFSAQPDTVSSEQSMTIGELVCSIVINGFDKLDGANRQYYLELIDHIIRKTAHFCEYMILGGFTFGVFRMTFKMQSRLIKTSFLWCVCYAMSDEIHQLFVSGRYGSVWDVLLDAAGALAGIVICTLLDNYIINEEKKK